MLELLRSLVKHIHLEPPIINEIFIGNIPKICQFYPLATSSDTRYCGKICIRNYHTFREFLRQSSNILELIKQETKVEVLPATVGIPYPHSWINLQHGRNLCGHLGLEQKLQPLIDYGRRFQRETVEPIYDYLTEVWQRPIFTYGTLRGLLHLETFSIHHNCRTSSACICP